MGVRKLEGGSEGRWVCQGLVGWKGRGEGWGGRESGQGMKVGGWEEGSMIVKEGEEAACEGGREGRREGRMDGGTVGWRVWWVGREVRR